MCEIVFFELQSLSSCLIICPWEEYENTNNDDRNIVFTTKQTNL